MQRAAKVANSFVWGKRFNRFDQPNRADGDEILQILSCVIEFFDDVNTKRCTIGLENPLLNTKR
jgi:hypothetical protein